MVLTNAFKEGLAGVLNGESFTAPTHIAWGGDSTSATATDTSLYDEIERNTVSVRTRTGKTIEYTATLLATEGNGSTLKEVGLFNASSNGTMTARNTFNDIEKNANFELQTTYLIKVD